MNGTTCEPTVLDRDRPVEAEEAALQPVLTALGDPDCRRILRVVSREARSASECSRACDLPLSTTYRKLERLAEGRLVTEQLRIRRDGKHTSEYSLDVDELRFSVGEDGDLEVTVRRSADQAGGGSSIEAHS